MIGRLWVPGLGAQVVAVTPADVLDLSGLASTCSALLDLPDVAKRVRAHVASGQAQTLARTPEALTYSDAAQRAEGQACFMAPCDLQPSRQPV